MSKRGQLLSGTSRSAMLKAETLVTRDDVRSALFKFEAQGLVKVDWSDPDKPVVTVLDQAALDRVINPDQARRVRRACRRHETTSR
ncbi:MAG TPA: hypothetical protein VIF88_08255 [Methylocystis sp.]